MFKSSTLKILSYIALIGCIIGFLLTSYKAFTSNEWKYYLSPISWILLAFSSYWAITIVQRHTYISNLKWIGWYIYFILFLFILFIIINISIGILPISFLAISLDNKKREIDKQVKRDKDI
jgi:predicted membrane protein